MRRTKDCKFRLIGFAGMVMAMCFLFFHFSITSYAAEGKVTAGSAKIRKEASTNSDMVGGAVQGDKYTIVAEVTGSDGYVWYQITFDGDKTGFIRSDLMEKTGEVSSTGGAATGTVTDVQPISATITGDPVRVRSEASTSGEILASVRKDVVVTITGQSKDSLGYTWYRVTFSSDSGEVTGFIREDFLSVSGTISPVVADDPVVEDPVVTDDPVTETPEVTDTPEVTAPYEVVQDGDVWYLIDYDGNCKYQVASLVDAANTNAKTIEDYQAKVKSQKNIVIFLVILVIVLGVLVTLLFLKVKDVMDEAYFTAVEKETIRQRQGQKANNSANANSNTAKNKNVMHTVGSGNNGAPVKTSVPKPTITKPVQQQKTAGAAPQTVKVSNPADTRAAKPVQQQKTAAPAGQKTVSTAAQQKQTTQTAQQARAVQQKPVENNNKQSWQSKNFMADEDDDFEFEFLNWDGNEDN